MKSTSQGLTVLYLIYIKFTWKSTADNFKMNLYLEKWTNLMELKCPGIEKHGLYKYS